MILSKLLLSATWLGWMLGTTATTPLRQLKSGKKDKNKCVPDDDDEDTGRTRWMFGAKYLDGTNISDVADAAKTLITSCEGYETAAMGISVDHSSSDYNIALFIDSANITVTKDQAACMVVLLTLDDSLRKRLTDTLIDAAEIGYAVNNTYLEEAQAVQATFVRFRNFAQRDWFAQRAAAFTFTAPMMVSYQATQDAGATLFPDAFLKAYPNDVHLGIYQSFDPENAAQNALIFWRYAQNNANNPDNPFLRSNPELLESKSIAMRLQLIE